MTEVQSEKSAVLIKPDLAFLREIKAAGGDTVKSCFQCATCGSVCPISPEEAPFPRKEMIWAGWGLKDRLLTDPDIWLCHQCNDCAARCPRGANPGDVLGAVRKRAFQHYATPSLLGKAVAAPSALIPLLLVPMAIIGLILWKGQAYNDAMPEFLQHESWYGHYFPLLAVDTLFILTVLVMGISVLFSLKHFWKDMVVALPGEPKKSFIEATKTTLIEIVKHERFDECDKAKPRRLGHQLTLFGMLALFATTTFVFLGLYLAGMHVPMAIYNPIKLLGIAGAVAFFAGLFMIYTNRMNNPEGAGKSTYEDMLFLFVLLVIAITGIGAYILRLVSPDSVHAAAAANDGAAIPMVAVAVYYVHLVSVWFMLAYLPFSKFAHMLYRTFALIRAHQVDRWAPRTE